MIPWVLLDSSPVPDGTSTLHLYQRGTEFSIRLDHHELMNSRTHGSEDALAELAFAKCAARVAVATAAATTKPSGKQSVQSSMRAAKVLPFKVLIGGLGMGYTAAAALKRLPAHGQLKVVELSETVIRWNQGLLADLAGRPLDDKRVTITVNDVANIMQSERRAYMAIMLDVDNGPQGLTRHENNWLYSHAGLGAAFAALQRRGVLAVWSAGPDEAFTRRLKSIGFTVEESRVRSRGDKGAWHTIWLAMRDA